MFDTALRLRPTYKLTPLRNDTLASLFHVETVTVHKKRREPRHIYSTNLCVVRD